MLIIEFNDGERNFIKTENMALFHAVEGDEDIVIVFSGGEVRIIDADNIVKVEKIKKPIEDALIEEIKKRMRGTKTPAEAQ